MRQRPRLLHMRQFTGAHQLENAIRVFLLNRVQDHRRVGVRAHKFAYLAVFDFVDVIARAGDISAFAD